MSEPGRLFIAGLSVLPKKSMSRAVRRLASVPARVAVRRFAEHFRLDMDEAERPLDEYGSILELFTRRLKPGVRPIDPEPRALVSPVDAQFLVGGPVCGSAGEGVLVQAKGKTFTLAALLADEGALSAYRRGTYLTMYLSPRHYHRIHSPADGRIVGYTYVPGALYPVNAAAVNHVDQLFARNERLITHVESPRFGRVAVVKVGATNVGHIKLAYDPTVATNLGAHEIVRHRYEAPIPVARGDDLGVFEMGSTVILVTEAPVQLRALAPQEELRVGERLGLASG
jgi:phosphatidylserine decarboxylase